MTAHLALRLHTFSSSFSSPHPLSLFPILLAGNELLFSIVEFTTLKGVRMQLTLKTLGSRLVSIIQRKIQLIARHYIAHALAKQLDTFDLFSLPLADIEVTLSDAQGSEIQVRGDGLFTHHTHIYIYMNVWMCVSMYCVCVAMYICMHVCLWVTGKTGLCSFPIL